MTYEPFQTIGEDRPGRWLVTCDHAANTVPPFVGGGTLGVHPEDMARHIAFDPGAAGVTTRLAELLDSPAILSNFSRLVIDPNRGEDDPTLLMRLYDGTIIPGNARADAEELERRLARCYRPYHDALARLAARREDTVILAIHSYTERLKGRPPRPWHIGILHAADQRLARPLIWRLRQEPDLCVGENEPYGGHLPGDSIDRHAEIPGRPSTLIELRNDLIVDQSQQYAWAERLAPILQEVLERSGV
ncbi:MAG: N-formylglutamate amidohydrolase [Confluentimicrobium sp.]|jgi:predicted N-formylglutamate amidohydrolase|uniref:N-formylglutamate amidohydrolase n=1 Tax=Actibacterium sp. TaxID=1872125 RepID=UPI00050FCC0C|nr:N-formylglutamate amidohydrolase [Actibacterium sp.]KGB82051.1 N-formylglutamate amidohydrolase [Rhodovulum sp. NI22]MBC58281.1 N-formylglutamate amidohydrolase [Actibacterium sp.]|tara:strand:- start:2795 stop:3535 length:741 start_codon:yes stop_codon:yes gene_type:complete